MDTTHYKSTDAEIEKIDATTLKGLIFGANTVKKLLEEYSKIHLDKRSTLEDSIKRLENQGYVHGKTLALDVRERIIQVNFNKVHEETYKLRFLFGIDNGKIIATFLGINPDMKLTDVLPHLLSMFKGDFDKALSTDMRKAKRMRADATNSINTGKYDDALMDDYTTDALKKVIEHYWQLPQRATHTEKTAAMVDKTGFSALFESFYFWLQHASLSELPFLTREEKERIVNVKNALKSIGLGHFKNSQEPGCVEVLRDFGIAIQEDKILAQDFNKTLKKELLPKLLKAQKLGLIPKKIIFQK